MTFEDGVMFDDAPDLPPEYLMRRIRARLKREGECLVWTGAGAPSYGKIKMDGKVLLVHRIVYEEAHGPLPEGIFALHSCDNPPCCELEHLFPGTAGDNSRDAAAKGRLYNPQVGKTHCVNGHLFTSENTYTRPDTGHRSCVICHREAVRRHEGRT